MRILSVGLSAVVVCCATGSGWADPLVTRKDGQPSPSVVTDWKGDGKKVELSLKEDADPREVATAIESGVEGVRTKVRSGKVLVIGLEQEPLLEALTEVEVGTDDLDVLAEAAALDEEFDTGSSLRAKKTASLQALLEDRETTAIGTVVEVSSGAFPKTQVLVRILSAPTSEALKEPLRKGQRARFQPVIAVADGRPDLADPATQTNIGAWYLKKGDRVRIKVGAPMKGGFRAALIAR